MMKKIYIVLMCLCFTAALVLIACIQWNGNSAEVQSVDVEQLRDQLKVYQVSEETENLPEEFPVETETFVPETKQILAAETEKMPVLETEETVIPESEEVIVPETEEVIRVNAVVTGEAETAESEQLPEPKPEPEMERVPQVSLDFESMWKANPDICAWIEIEGTKVDYPILQSPTDDEKYLTTAVDGSYYIGGSIFTQATYNSRDFNDPVTLIYGHTMKSGTLFGQLQTTYSSTDGFAEHSEIKLYLPDEVWTYTVFAAVPYSNIHIPATYDFSKKYWFNNFFDGISGIRELGAQFNRDIIPEYGDRVIILSTCMNEDSTRRYLVMAIYQDDID